MATDPDTGLAEAAGTTAVISGHAEPLVEASPAAGARGRRIAFALVGLCAVAVAAFAALWVMQMRHAHDLSMSLAASRATLASTQSRLAQTQGQLAAATSLSNERRQVLLQAKDVLAKVDSLLSSADTIQNNAANVGSQGSVLGGDAETFISTVSTLVNYMLNTNAAYYDYAWMNQEIDNANAELGTIRADEAIFSGDTSAYGSASTDFGTQASAFTASVRKLEKQLNAAVGK